jgi:hypothetical protein
MPRCRLILVAPLIAAAGASAQNATFDSFAEGFFNTVISENGITFRDLDQRIPGSPPPSTMAIEDASATLSGAGFSSPNALGFGGYSPGPGGAFGRFGSVRILPPSPRSRADLEVFEFGTDAQNSVSLAAYFNGQEVARQTVPMPGGFAIHHLHLHVTGPNFDEVRLSGEGPVDQGVFFGLVDNVTFTEVDCYPNCDGSTIGPVLNVSDFSCFLNRFAAGDSYANCDGSTIPPVLNISDFSCFLNLFAQGCP